VCRRKYYFEVQEEDWCFRITMGENIRQKGAVSAIKMIADGCFRGKSLKKDKKGFKFNKEYHFVFIIK